MMHPVPLQPEFVAPEVLKDAEHVAAEGCGPAVDMWAVGVIVYYLLSAKVGGACTDCCSRHSDHIYIYHVPGSLSAQALCAS